MKTYCNENPETVKELEAYLLEYVRRTVKETATPEELAILPNIAALIVEINRF